MSSFQILTVCSGNICRSPFAEQLLRAGLSQLPGVEVSSAGTMALVGEATDARAAAFSRQHGGDPSTHSARQLAVDHVRDSDLVLGMSREHRRAVVELLPRVSRHTFTLREFARLVADLTDDDLIDAAALPREDVAGRLASVVELAASRRGMVLPPESPDDDDIVDPYRHTDEVYALSSSQLVPAAQAVVSVLTRATTV